MKFAILLAIVWLGGVSPKESFLYKDRSRARTKTTKSFRPKDICGLELSESNNIRCLCTNEKNHRFTSAECWLFGSTSSDDWLWELVIKSQKDLVDFKLAAGNQDNLKSIPSWFFQNMINLKNFSISFSHLGYLPKYAFGNFSSLQELVLSNNRIETLDKYAIAGLHSLRTIHLDQNRIDTIRYGNFYDLPSLISLFLNKNNISLIEDKAFMTVNNALELDLSENNLCEINNLTFFGLSQLKVIDLSMNRILSLASSVFSELWDLEDLYLDYNLISFISNRAFDGLRFLKRVSLSNNRLTRFPPGSLTSIFTLLNLDLSNNKLDTLVFDSIEPFYHNLKDNGTIHLKGNNFRCDCRLEWMYLLYEKSTRATLKSSLEEVQCSLTEDKTVPSTDITVNLVCPGPGKTVPDPQTEELNEIPQSNNKLYLLTMPENDLPCPDEYRPTPITVKQGTTFFPPEFNMGKILLLRLEVELFLLVIVLYFA